MKILVTGATGLLGQCVMRELATHHSPVGACHRQTAPGMIPLDIEQAQSVQDAIRTDRYDCIVHCAALRSPEYCLEHPEEAYKVNGLALEYIAAAANQTGARLLHVSTDYVFDGQTPPYRESDLPHPINCYGRTKLAGEHAARSAKRHLILRIPALWRTDFNDPRNVATGIVRQLRSGQTLHMDHETVRYYTLADDVAAAIRFCIEQRAEGTLHVSAEQKTSKADFARRIAGAIGLPPTRVIDSTLPATGDARPPDSHISSGAYRCINGPPLTSIDTALAALQPTPGPQAT